MEFLFSDLEKALKETRFRDVTLTAWDVLRTKKRQLFICPEAGIQFNAAMSLFSLISGR